MALSLPLSSSAYHLNGISRGIFWTNGTALLLSKEMDRIEPYHLVLSFDISVRGPGSILYFFSEMLPQGAWHQVIDNWRVIFGNSG